VISACFPAPCPTLQAYTSLLFSNYLSNRSTYSLFEIAFKPVIINSL
jgi:hypothetical protein